MDAADALPARPGRGGRRHALCRRLGDGRHRVRRPPQRERRRGRGARAARQAGAARALAHRRTLRTTTSSVFDSAATAHANNAIATAGLLWVRNNLQSTSELHLFELATGAPVRALLLGGPNCHNPLFYRAAALSRRRAASPACAPTAARPRFGRRAPSGSPRASPSSTTSRTSDSRARRGRPAIATSPPWSSRRSTSPPAASCGACRCACLGCPTSALASSTPSARPRSPTCSWRAAARASPRRMTDPLRGCLAGGERRAGAHSARRRRRRPPPPPHPPPRAPRVRRRTPHPRRGPNDAQRRHLTSLYFSRVHGRLAKPTYNLLRALVEAADPDAPHAPGARAVQAAVARLLATGSSSSTISSRTARRARDVPAVAPGLRVLAHWRGLRREFQRLGVAGPPRPQPLI